MLLDGIVQFRDCIYHPLDHRDDTKKNGKVVVKLSNYIS